jgi:hypothetical protein
VCRGRSWPHYSWNLLCFLFFHHMAEQGVHGPTLALLLAEPHPVLLYHNPEEAKRGVQGPILAPLLVEPPLFSLFFTTWLSKVCMGRPWPCYLPSHTPFSFTTTQRRLSEVCRGRSWPHYSWNLLCFPFFHHMAEQGVHGPTLALLLAEPHPLSLFTAARGGVQRHPCPARHPVSPPSTFSAPPRLKRHVT